MMMRTRDENFIILRRGGVIQIGSTPVCQTMYVPIRNMLRHFCENYEVNCFGGQLTWFTERTDQTVDGSVLTTFSLKARERANDPLHVATLTVGSHGEEDPAIVELIVYDSGLDSQQEKARLVIDKEGNVDLSLEKDLNVTARNSARFEALEGDFEIEAVKGKVSATSMLDMALTTKANFKAAAIGMVDVKATGNMMLDGVQILVGAGAVSPAVKFTQLQLLLTTFASFFADPSVGGVCTGPLAPLAGIRDIVIPLLPLCQSVKVKVAE